MTGIKWTMVLLALVVISLLSLSPFMNDTMPLSDDGSLHIYRSIVLDDAIRNDGSLYPRYTSSLAYGYGASLFNYFPPTSYYPVVFFHAIGSGWTVAWKLTLALFVLLAGAGTYLWARQWVHDSGALIASVMYIYAPYTLFDTVTRGSSNEFAGMALLPFALWGFTRLAHSGTRANFLIAVFSYALFIVAHNVMTLYGSLLLVGYAIFLWLMKKGSLRVLFQLAFAGIFAILITGFFWSPALLETDAVKIDGVLENLDFIDVTNTLRSIGDVFALPRTVDPAQLQAIIPISFSWIAIILAIAGFFLPQPPLTDQNQERSILGLHLFLFATLVIVIISQLHLSSSGWQSIPLLQYSQFAWRPMSIGSLVLALLAGIGANYLIRLIPGKNPQYIAFALLVSAIVLYSVPWLYRPQIEFNPQTIRDAQDYESQSAQITLSSYGEYLPVQTDETALNPRYFESDSSRLQENPSIAIDSIDEHSRRLTTEITVLQDTTVVSEWLYVPGWQVRVDGQKVVSYASGDAGFLAFDVEAGEHRIRIYYGGTPIQNLSFTLSVTILILTLIVAYFLKPSSGEESFADEPSVPLAVILIVCGVALVGIKTQIIDRSNNIFRDTRFENGTIQDVMTPLDVTFNNEIHLIGAELESSGESGDSVDVQLYLTLTGETISEDYSVLVRMVDSQGIVIAESSNFFPGGLATSNWLPGYYIEDTIQLEIPDFTLPVAYELRASLVRSDNGQAVDILNVDGNPIAIDTSIGQIQVERPAIPPETIDLPLPLLTSSGLELLAVDDLADSAQVGDEMIFSILWRAINPQDELDISIRWQMNESTMPVRFNSDFPVSEWQAGDIFRTYHRAFVPPDLQSGNARVIIATGAQSTSIPHVMSISVPERMLESPEIDNELDISWENGIVLRGYNLTDNGIQLIWQTEQILDESLRLFVQVFDDAGQLLIVDDGIPVNRQRSTSGWITGEFITTEHSFNSLEAGEYGLLIGWYRELTGERLFLSNTEGDAFELTYERLSGDGDD